jgi:hypothetical protein
VQARRDVAAQLSLARNHKNRGGSSSGILVCVRSNRGISSNLFDSFDRQGIH